MDIAIVTGASSSLGLAISRRLMQMGFRVYGLGGDYSNCPINNVNFKPYNCDLSDPVAVEEAARQILEKEKGVYVLINNAKYFGKNDYLEMDSREMERILRINLLCPLVLAKTLANSLMTLQGFLIQLGSPQAETSRGGPVGAAASGGLKWMGDVLFHDLRHQGVKVCHLSPEPNRGRDPRTMARPGARLEASIDPEAVAQAIEQILQSPFGNIVTELVLRPLRVREPEHDPVVKLPRPQPMPVPYTVPREMIEAEDQLEDEEIEKNLRRKRQRRRSRKSDKKDDGQPERNAGKQETGEAKSDPDAAETKPSSGQQKKQGKRGPRRGKPQQTGNDGSSGAKETPAQLDSREEKEKDPRTAGQEPGKGPKRHRSRRKPKPPLTQVGFLDRQNKEQPPGDKPQEAPSREQKEPAAAASQNDTGDPSARKTARKAARKATKKTVRKAAAKKTPAKKAARKAAKKAAPRKTAKKKAPAEKAGNPDESKSG